MSDALPQENFAVGGIIVHYFYRISDDHVVETGFFGDCLEGPRNCWKHLSLEVS